jgi:hypothetical protein
MLYAEQVIRKQIFLQAEKHISWVCLVLLEAIR